MFGVPWCPETLTPDFGRPRWSEAIHARWVALNNEGWRRLVKETQDSELSHVLAQKDYGAQD